VRVAIAANHDRGALGHPAIALPQRHIVAVGEIDQFFQRPVAQPRIGWMCDRLAIRDLERVVVDTTVQPNCRAETTRRNPVDARQMDPGLRTG